MLRDDYPQGSSLLHSRFQCRHATFLPTSGETNRGGISQILSGARIEELKIKKHKIRRGTYVASNYWCNFRREQFGATVGWFAISTCRSEGSRRPELEEKELQSRTSFTQKPKQSALKCR